MHPDSDSNVRFDFLDVARGVAAFLVMMEHGLHICIPKYLEVSRAYVIIGQAAIPVFFMVSGFVIPMSLEKGRSNAGFWVRRFFRLFPVYWLSIGLGFAYLCAGGQHSLMNLTDTKTWLANLVLVQEWLNCPHVWGVFWTLPFEVAIYITCSLLFACRLLNWIGGRVCIVVLIVFGLFGIGRPLLAGVPLQIDGMRNMVFLCTLFGLVAHRHVSGRLSRRMLYGIVTLLVAVIACVASANHALFPSVVTPFKLARFGCIWALAFGFFLFLLEMRHRQMPKVLSWLGRHSYPIYLIHPFVLLLLLPTVWPFWLFMPCLVCSTLLLAALTHRLVEQPGIALGKLIEKRLRSLNLTNFVIAGRLLQKPAAQ